MARLRVEKNIYFDDVKNCYYVNLGFGKGENGKRIQKSINAFDNWLISGLDKAV